MFTRNICSVIGGSISYAHTSTLSNVVFLCEFFCCLDIVIIAYFDLGVVMRHYMGLETPSVMGLSLPLHKQILKSKQKIKNTTWTH